MIKKIILFLIYILIFTPFMYGEGTKGGQVLEVSYTARDRALAEADTADVPDISSFSYNPGALPLLQNQEISATYFHWLSDISFGAIGYSQALRKGVITGNIIYWGMQNFNQFDANGNDVNSPLSYSGVGLSVGYGMPINKQLDLGLKAKFYSESLMGNKADLLIFDIGSLYKFNIPSLNSDYGFQDGQNLDLGLQAQNLGGFIKNFGQSDQAPLVFKLGSHYKAYEIDNNIFYLNIDIQEYLNESTNFCFGLEYNMTDLLFIRAGYFLTTTTSLNSFTAGIGVKYLITSNILAKLDYGLVPQADFGYTHFITLCIAFPKKSQISQ